MTVAEKHNHAIDLAEKGFRILNSNTELARELFEEAYHIEKDIAETILQTEENEPSRSIFFKSAASLALNAKLFREAEKMATMGLSGYPPEEIAEELRSILHQVNFEKYPKRISGLR